MPQQQQQQTSTNMGMNKMPEPPKMISSKDAMYIKDMLSWNLLTCKKAHFLAQQCQDTEVKNEIEQCCHMHERHYQKLLGYLNPAYSQQSQTYQQ